jgi:hypothetical protein
MNISNRLEKLENQLNIGGEFCACFPQGSETWKQEISDDGLSYTKPVLMSEAIPDFCAKCTKPKVKNRIILCFGDLDYPLQEPPPKAS